jgi:DNA recombination protein RmuC
MEIYIGLAIVALIIIIFVLIAIKLLGDMLNSTQKQTAEMQDKRLSELNAQLTERNNTLQKTVNDMLVQIDTKVNQMQENNNKKLDEMKTTVDEKLQKTLEDKISQSFKLVSERLEQVYKGLGEMQNLATGVGDLKKVLTNVKSRGVLGEIQLGAILEQILSPEQYEINVTTKPNSSNFVEFAVKLPGDEDGVVYLPIDSKFPGDAYANLVDAYESGDPERIDSCVKILIQVIKNCAKDIKEKYLYPPYTTDFGIMFLPFEGLYAEVLRHGLIEELQDKYKVVIAGPTTMAALLNSLQMGFKTLAIQKRSSEVWKILGAVKTEFDTFAAVLSDTQKRLEQANDNLDKLVGVRTRQIQRKLNSVTSLEEIESKIKLDDSNEE